MKQYSIPYKGLREGEHKFNFEIDNALFEAFGRTEIQGGKLHAEIVMLKSASILKLQTVVGGEVTVECDRCLEALQLPVHYEGELKVKFSDAQKESDGDVMWISKAEPEVELGQYLYESILLSLPYQKVHADIKDCNQEMLSRFRIVSSEEFDEIATPHKTLGDEQEMMKLKELKDKLENKKD